MKKVSVVFFSLWVLLIGANISHAQPTNWDAWLYEPETRHIWQVNEHGDELVNRYLPIPDITYSIMSQNVGISHSGRYVAYFAQHETNFDYRFLLYDFDERTMFSSVYSPPMADFQRHSLDYVGGTSVFSQDDRYLAIGMQTNAEHWEIVVIDVTTRRIVYTLSSDDALVSDVGLDRYGVPVVQRVTNTSVHFSYLKSLEGITSLDSYQWDFSTGALFYQNLYGNIPTDELDATGETIFPIQNTNFDNMLESLSTPMQLNVVEAYDPSYGNFVFYNNRDVTIHRATFVQNGARVLITEFDMRVGQPFWSLQERNGTILDRQNTILHNSVAGTPNGYILATDDRTSGRGTLLHYDTTGESIRSIFLVWTAPDREYPRIMAVNNYVPVNRAEFTAWQIIPAPTLGVPPLPATEIPPAVPTSVVLPTPSSDTDRPLAAGELVIGGRARVYTTDGDVLNLRSGPGTGYAVLDRLTVDMRVTVMEGPIAAEGFTWWRVETDTGTSGWAVDFVDGIPTLLPE